jgi:catechol 2,3-dioxygenase-like lactoylglutathione lyase family enzyme
MTEQTTPTITGVITIGVPVTDQDRALAFYVETLGLDQRRDVPLPQFGGRWIEVAPAGAPVTIALVPAREATPAGVQTGIRLATTDAAATHGALAAAGVEVGELLRWPGVPPMFGFRDPDGNGLEIVEEGVTGVPGRP